MGENLSPIQRSIIGALGPLGPGAGLVYPKDLYREICGEKPVPEEAFARALRTMPERPFGDDYVFHKVCNGVYVVASPESQKRDLTQVAKDILRSDLSCWMSDDAYMVGASFKEELDLKIQSGPLYIAVNERLFPKAYEDVFEVYQRQAPYPIDKKTKWILALLDYFKDNKDIPDEEWAKVVSLLGGKLMDRNMAGMAFAIADQCYSRRVMDRLTDFMQRAGREYEAYRQSR